jgi:hypothetical protein
MAHGSRHALQPAGMTQYTSAGGRAGSCCKGKHPECLTSPLLCCRMHGRPRVAARVAPAAARRCELTLLLSLKYFQLMISSTAAASSPETATRRAACLRLERLERRVSTLDGLGIGVHCACTSAMLPYQGLVSDWPGCSASAHLAVVSVIHRCGSPREDAISAHQTHTYMCASVTPEAADCSAMTLKYSATRLHSLHGRVQWHLTRCDLRQIARHMCKRAAAWTFNTCGAASCLHVKYPNVEVVQRPIGLHKLMLQI